MSRREPNDNAGFLVRCASAVRGVHPIVVALMAGPRRFDHDEARRRYAAGEKIPTLVAEYEVSYNAVWQVVSARGYESNRRSTSAYLARNRVPCETCGQSCLSLAIAGKARHNTDGRALCVRCRADEKRERLLFDDRGSLVSVRCCNLACANGERWQAPENFSRGERHREVRDGGIHGSCRGCQTRARREYRHRNSEVRSRESIARRRRYRERQSA